MRRIVRIMSLFFLTMLGACGFANKNFDQSGGPLVHTNDFVIQVDDYGSFWNPEIPARALDAIAQSAQYTNTIVIIAVHGWHHNAEPDDEFEVGFAKTLQEIRKRLDDNVEGQPCIYRRYRQLLTGNGDVNIFGIYIGWRGKALPSLLNYLTFWDRKNAAERVGDGDLREFLLRLNKIYRTGYKNRKPLTPYVGMASIGHSLGAQVLFKAISGTLEEELIEVTKSGLGAARPKEKLAEPLEGFGDIVVFVNPAFEAFQFERIRRLEAQLTYDRRQPPLLLVLSADTDVSRRLYFPIGRFVDAIFRAPMREEQSDLWKYALGEYEPQRTHKITFLTEEQTSGANSDISESQSAEWDQLVHDRPCDIVNYDLTDIPTIARVRLEPLAGRHHSYSPFLIAYGGKELIRGHSGIFEQELRNFINVYIGITRAKRLLLADPRMQHCPEPEQREPPTTPAK